MASLPCLYSARTGTVPCPTLSSAMGLALALSGLRPRARSLTPGGFGAFHGLFAGGCLDLTLDWFLLVGALLLPPAAMLFMPAAQMDAAANGQGSSKGKGNLR